MEKNLSSKDLEAKVGSSHDEWIGLKSMTTKGNKTDSVT